MENLERLIHNTPLLIPALSVSTGILACSFMNVGTIPGFIAIALAITLYIIFTYLHKTPALYYRLRNYHYVWLFLCFFGLGLITANIHKPTINQLKSDLGDCSITGIVYKIQYSNSGDIIILDPIEISDSTGVGVKVKNTKFKLWISASDCQVGDIVRCNVQLRRIRDSESSFHTGYAKYMNTQGIFYQGDIKSETLSIVNNSGNLILMFSASLRNRLEESIENTHLNKQTQNFLIAVLLGDKDYISEDYKNLFSNAGVSHILALSGMHVGIIAGLLMIIFLPLNFTGRYKSRLLFTMLTLWFYAFLTGMSPSTVRACIMCSFVFIAIMLERKNYALNSFCGAALFILIFSPSFIFDIGFQLSFACVGAFILFHRSNVVSQKNHPCLFKIVNFILVTLIATFGTWVITSYYFHIFPLAFLPANLICIPLLPLYLLLGIIYLVFSSFGLEIGIIRFSLDESLGYMFRFLEYISTNHIIHLNIPKETVIFWIIGIIILAVYISAYRKKAILFSAIASFSFSIVFIFLFPPQFSNNDYIVTNQFRDIKLNIMQLGEEKSINLKRNQSHLATIGAHKIAIIDCDINNPEMYYDVEAVVVASGFKGNIQELANSIHNATFIIHPSVRRKKEQEYINELTEKNKPTHSLRLDGPYKSFQHQ